MKEALLRSSARYSETFRRTRLLTQIFAFCVALILLMNFAHSALRLYAVQINVSDETWRAVIKELTLQISIAMLFATRFALLFFKKNVSFWLSQFVWLVTYLVIVSQVHSTQSGGCLKNMLPAFGENFAYVFVAYLVFSPLRQFVTLFASLSGTFRK